MSKPRYVNYADTISALINADTEVRTYIADAAITAGHWVQLDLASYSGSSGDARVIQGTAAGGQYVVGVALEAAAAAGDPVRVAVAGFVKDANVASATYAAGAPLMAANTGAGTAYVVSVTGTSAATTFTGSPLPVIGFSVDAVTGSAVTALDVIVIKRF